MMMDHYNRTDILYHITFSVVLEDRLLDDLVLEYRRLSLYIMEVPGESEIDPISTK